MQAPRDANGKPKACTVGLTALLWLFGVQSGEAQDFRVYTVVYDESRAAVAEHENQSPAVARTLTLFHAGRAYDYVESVREVIVFDPAHERFTILNTGRGLATTVSFDEVERLLGIAVEETERTITQMQQSRDPRAQRVAASLRFQMSPEFQREWDEPTRTLTLSSPYVRYRVRCATADRPGFVSQYLRYADWMSKLNYVLHPGGLLPGPRMTLNARLRERDVIPVEVELQTRAPSSNHLRAEHSIVWEMGSTGQQQIHHWEQQLRQEQTRRVSFREYQEALLGRRQ